MDFRVVSCFYNMRHLTIAHWSIFWHPERIKWILDPFQASWNTNFDSLKPGQLRYIVVIPHRVGIVDWLLHCPVPLG